MTLQPFPRDFVGVRGPDAAAYLQAMVSNDVEALGLGDTCDALLLTPKARVIAPLTVQRRAADDFLLVTPPGLGERVRSTLLRSRFAAKCGIEREEHVSTLVVGAEAPQGGISNRDYGVPAYELLDGEPPPPPAVRPAEPDDLERLRILARSPAWGREIDDRVLPAEAGLDARAVDFAKGCYPGQEPIARQHYRGRVNRTLRALALEGDGLPAYDADISLGEKVVGRVTSAVRDGGRALVLGYVRRETPADAPLVVEGRAATQLDLAPARP